MSVFDRLVNLGKGVVSSKTKRGDEDQRLLEALEEELGKAREKAGGALGTAREAVQQAMARADAGAEASTAPPPETVERKPAMPDPLAEVGAGNLKARPAGPVPKTFDGPARDDLLPDETKPVKKTF